MNTIFKRRLKTLSILCGLVLCVSIFIQPTSVTHADNAYSPGSLIADPIFTAKDSMSVGDIQAFLTAKGSVLATASTALLGQDANGRSAAQIIYDASRANVGRFGGINNFTTNLNPEVILATLQKETSLITTHTDTSLFNIAMGYACPDSGGCNSNYAGFADQVTYGAAQLSLGYIRAQGGTNSYVVGSTYTFNDPSSTLRAYCINTTTSVTIQNASTASLYTYTPHACDGNVNFWILMNLWFQPSIYKAPALVLNPADGTVYVVDDNGRWAVTGAGFQAWNFSWSNVTTITPTQLQLPVKSLITELPVDGNGTVYYMDNGFKRPVSSPQVMTRFNLSWADVSYVSDPILSQVPYGLPMHELVLPSGGDGTIYMATNGQRYPMTADAFSAWGFVTPLAAEVPGYALSNLPVGSLMTRLSNAVNGDGTVFFVDRGIGYMLSAAVAQAWGFDLSQTRTVNASLLNAEGAGGLLTTLAIADQGNGTIYLISGGQKHPISGKVWSAHKYSGSDVRTISSAFLNTLTTGSPAS